MAPGIQKIDGSRGHGRFFASFGGALQRLRGLRSLRLHMKMGGPGCEQLARGLGEESFPRLRSLDLDLRYGMMLMMMLMLMKEEEEEGEDDDVSMMTTTKPPEPQVRTLISGTGASWRRGSWARV
jgi:hypothetical protein